MMRTTAAVAPVAALARWVHRLPNLWDVSHTTITGGFLKQSPSFYFRSTDPRTRDCQGPKMTAPAVLTTTVSGVVITTTTSATHSHTHSHHNDDDDDDHKTTDKPGTGSLKPSPTESFGCTAHGDHWHCEGRVGASATGTGTSRSSSTAGAASPTSGVGRAQAVGFGFGIVAAAAVGLAL